MREKDGTPNSRNLDTPDTTSARTCARSDAGVSRNTPGNPGTGSFSANPSTTNSGCTNCSCDTRTSRTSARTCGS